MWRRLANRARPITPDPDPYIRRPQNNNNAYARWQPEMFDAWMGGRASDDLEWEKSMVSVTGTPRRWRKTPLTMHIFASSFIAAFLRDDPDGRGV